MFGGQRSGRGAPRQPAARQQQQRRGRFASQQASMTNLPDATDSGLDFSMGNPSNWQRNFTNGTSIMTGSRQLHTVNEQVSGPHFGDSIQTMPALSLDRRAVPDFSITLADLSNKVSSLLITSDEMNDMQDRTYEMLEEVLREVRTVSQAVQTVSQAFDKHTTVLEDYAVKIEQLFRQLSAEPSQQVDPMFYDPSST